MEAGVCNSGAVEQESKAAGELCGRSAGNNGVQISVGQLREKQIGKRGI
ncbi:MAG: hypothetical protein NC541_04055 [bacterium]|nr:hypothetical protein [bacterium]